MDAEELLARRAEQVNNPIKPLATEASAEGDSDSLEKLNEVLDRLRMMFSEEPLRRRIANLQYDEAHEALRKCRDLADRISVLTFGVDLDGDEEDYDEYFDEL